MSVLKRIAYFQGRRDEVPNQELAKQLVETQDRDGIQEIAANLWHKDANVRSDCLKVLYEVGYLEPALIADYVGEFFKLLQSRNNRLVWGAMIALSTIATLKADDLFQHRAEMQKAMAAGSVITVDAGVKALAGVASQKNAYREELFPHLLLHLQSCRPKDVPQHAESTLVAVDATHGEAFVAVLEKRLPDLSSSQAARVRKVIRAAKAMGSH
jgi:hypothetical protein